MKNFIEIKANNKSLYMRKLIHGKGINDAWYQTQRKENGKSIICPFYKTWKSMIARCYSEKYQQKQPTYKGCSVIKEWHLFSNFKKWMKKQDWKDKHLDKDIFEIGNKVYGPDSCVFIDKNINNLILKNELRRGKYPLGVSKSKKSFQ